MNTISSINVMPTPATSSKLAISFTSDALSGSDLVTFVARADTKGVKQGETVRALVPSTYNMADLSEAQKQELLELSLRAAFVEMVRESVKEAKPTGLYNGDSLNMQPISAIAIFQWLTEKAERTAPYKPSKESIATLLASLMPYSEASFMASRGLEAMPAGASQKMLLAYTQVFISLVTKQPSADILEKLSTLFALVTDSGDTELMNNKDYQYFSKRVTKLLSATIDDLNDFM